MDTTPRLNYGFYKVGAPVSRRDVFVFVYSRTDQATFALANALQNEFKHRNLHCEAWAAEAGANLRTLKDQGISDIEIPCVIYRDFDGNINVSTDLTSPKFIADWVKQLRIASALAVIKAMSE